MKKKRTNLLITILIGLMTLGICSNAFINSRTTQLVNEIKGITGGLLTVNRIAFSQLGYLSSKLHRPKFNELLEGTVVIYNEGSMASGVCIKEDENYYYILTVAHIIDKSNRPPNLIVAPESNLGYAVNLKTINRFLRNTSNKIMFPALHLVNITLYNYDSHIGEVIKKDSFYDLALIRIVKKEYNKIRVLPLSKMLVKTGDKVFICGHPLGIYYNITEGIISNLHDKTFMVVDATMTFGNSGGGVYNQFGELIGICSKVPVYFAVELAEREEQIK